ncbi:hypothetical protein [Novosphingobium sp.]|uniref:hypothetical protein n=1 Tax=Novosphingobium sp. TaxID=1874826 RepID=UPI002FDFDE00
MAPNPNSAAIVLKNIACLSKPGSQRRTGPGCRAIETPIVKNIMNAMAPDCGNISNATPSQPVMGMSFRPAKTNHAAIAVMTELGSRPASALRLHTASTDYCGSDAPISGDRRMDISLLQRRVDWKLKCVAKRHCGATAEIRMLQ